MLEASIWFVWHVVLETPREPRGTIVRDVGQLGWSWCAYPQHDDVWCPQQM